MAIDTTSNNGSFMFKSTDPTDNGLYTYSNDNGFAQPANTVMYGNVSIQNNLTVQNNATIQANLTVQNVATFQSNVTIAQTLAVNSASASYVVDIIGNDGIRIPVGNTAQRPAPFNGVIRYNTDLSAFEFAAAGNWGATPGGGASFATDESGAI